MKTTLVELLLLSLGLIALLSINASLVACETALVKLRYSSAGAINLAALRKRRRLSYLLDNAASAAPVIRFGIVAATIGLGGLLFPLLSLGLMQIPLLDKSPGRTIAAILGFIIAVTFIRLVGFLAPRGVALAKPEQALRWTSWFALGVVAAIQPWFRFLQRLIVRLFKAFNMPFELDLNVLDVEVQIRALADEKTAPLASPYLRRVVGNTLRLRELEVSDVLLPRNQVQYMDIEKPLADNLSRARATRHTRFPLCRGSLDQCLGIIHIKDVFIADDGSRTRPRDLAEICRPLLVFRADTPVEEALQTLLERKVHMGIVRDDFGGALGVVTLDSILEEIVGDIADEFDNPARAQIVRYADNRYRIEGLTPIHDVEAELGLSIDSEEVSTFGGLLAERLGRIPEKGEVIELPDLGLKVTAAAVDERRVITTLVETQSLPDPAAEV